FQGLGLSAAEVETLLYKKSGLLAISGISNDMRDLLPDARPEAKLAVDYFVYRVAKEIGAMTAVLGGLDGLVFTAGIGENSPAIRQRICEASAWLGVELDADANAAHATRISRASSPVSVWVVRTKGIWRTLEALFVEERKKGVLDVSQIPSSITAHAPGYIDRDNEIIVGLQTEAPLKRAIMPNGGYRMVANALKAYDFEADPH